MLTNLKKIKSIFIVVLLLAPTVTMAQIGITTFLKSHATSSADNGLINGLVLNLEVNYQNVDTLIKRKWIDLNGNHQVTTTDQSLSDTARSPAYFLLDSNNYADLNFIWPSDFTCVFWVYSLGGPYGQNSRVLASADNQFQIVINKNEVSYFTENKGWQNSKVVLNKNSWNQLVFVKTANTLKVYLNAKKKFTTAINLNHVNGIFFEQRHNQSKESNLRFNNLLIYKVGLSENDISTNFNTYGLRFNN
jgi:hypothetical protein